MADEPVKEEVILKQEEVLPLLPKEEAPSGKEDIPQAKEETSESNEDPKIESLVPKTGVKAEIPPPKDDIPSAKEVERSVKEDVPSSKESVTGDIAIAEEKSKEDVPIAREDVPTAKEDTLIAQEDTLIEKEDVPIAKEDVPIAKEDIPTTKEDVPTAQEDVPLKTNVVSPKRVEPEDDMASDPEEDDLSDLDDVLDEFAATKIDSKAPVPSVPTAGPERPPPEELLATDQDEFAKQLQAEMEQLLGQEDFKKQFEDIMKEMGDVLPPLGASDSKEEASIPAKASVSASASTSTSADKTEKSFQDTIRKTMERMQESGEQASAAAASSDGDDILAQMLKEMESGGFGGEGSDEDFSKILMGMMEQLTNREVLYEPMKELNDKYPTWMEENKSKVQKDDLKRYEEQQTLVREIVGRFERKGYSDDNTQDREYIVERMQKMQAAGSPPPDLVGSMNAAQEALSEIDQGCPQQ